MRRSPTIESPMISDSKDRMDNRGSSSETNCLAVDVDVGLSDRCIRKIHKQQSKTSNKNEGSTTPGIKKMSLACMQASVERLSKNVEHKISDQLVINKMSLACMQASSERLSKNFDRKMSKPIIKKESKVNVNDKQIKKLPNMMTPTTIKKMSLACMQASSERLSKNFDRKMSKPIIKKESKVNVNDKQIKKVPNMMTTTTEPRRSVFELTKTRLLVPLTPEPARLKHQCIHENTFTLSYMSPKKDVAVQAVPLPLFQQQTAEMNATDDHPPQLLSRKTLDNDAPYKDIVKKFNTILRKNIKKTVLFKNYIDNLSGRRIVAAASTHDYWKYLMYFSTFSIGVITTYMLNYGWYHLQRMKNTSHLFK